MTRNTVEKGSLEGYEAEEFDISGRNKPATIAKATEN
jgi:hypothetical protein